MSCLNRCNMDTQNRADLFYIQIVQISSVDTLNQADFFSVCLVHCTVSVFRLCTVHKKIKKKCVCFFYQLAGKAISVAARTRSLPHPPAIPIALPPLSLSLFLARNFSLKHFCHVCHLFIFFFCRCSWLCECVCVWASVCTSVCVWKYIFVIFTQRFVGFLRRCLFLPLGFRFGFVFGVSSLGFCFGLLRGKGGEGWQGRYGMECAAVP